MEFLNKIRPELVSGSVGKCISFDGCAINRPAFPCGMQGKSRPLNFGFRCDRHWDKIKRNLGLGGMDIQMVESLEGIDIGIVSKQLVESMVDCLSCGEEDWTCKELPSAVSYEKWCSLYKTAKCHGSKRVPRFPFLSNPEYHGGAGYWSYTPNVTLDTLLRSLLKEDAVGLAYTQLENGSFLCNIGELGGVGKTLEEAAIIVLGRSTGFIAGGE